MNYGLGGSVGASAASGLQAGFGMGLAATAQEDARKQRAFENDRQTTQDRQRADQLSRSNTAADKASAEHDDDRAMVGHVAERDDLRYQLGAARAASPDGTLSRDVADPLYAKIRDNHGRISALNAKKAQPIIDATQQKWRDFASKAEAGQADPSTLRGQDLRDFIKANTGHDLADFASGKVGGAIDDATAGMQSGNMGMAVRAAGTLLKPHINQKLGGPAADGSTIVDKDLYALVPAPAQTSQAPATPPLKGLMDMLNQGMQPGQNASVQPSAAAGVAQPPQPGMQPGQQAPVQPSGPPPLQPGTDPNLLMPVLDVTTRQPDGTLTKYHAPVTQDRSADPGAPHAQPLKMTDLTDRMGRLGVLDKWLKQPEMQDAVKEALASKPTSYEQMWAMVHGDPTNLTGDGAKDATSLKIAAGKKLAKELGVSFADAMRQLAGKSDAAGGTAATGATGQSIAAIQKLADEKYNGNFTAAAQALKGHVGAPDPTGGVSGAAPAPSAAGSGVGAPVAPAEQQARDAEGLKIMQGERPRWEKAVADAKASGDPKAVTKAQGDLDAFNRGVTRQEKLASAAAPATGIKPAPATSAIASATLGGAIAPDPATADRKKVVDFWAHAVIAGDKDWAAGISRNKVGAQLIVDVKNRVPVLAGELGLEPQDIGTARAHSAALGAALKDLTKRSEAVDLFSSKVEKDMKTFDAMLTKAGSDSPLLLNKPINMLRRQFSDSDLAKLDLAAQQVGTEYERLITGGTLSVAQLHAGAAEDAKKLINGDMPPKQARAIMEIMRVEMQNARDAAHESTARMTDKLRNLGRGSGPAAGPAPAPGGRAPGITGSPAVYASEQEAASAAAAGKLKPGERITINGQTGTWH